MRSSMTHSSWTSGDQGSTGSDAFGPYTVAHGHGHSATPETRSFRCGSPRRTLRGAHRGRTFYTRLNALLANADGLPHETAIPSGQRLACRSAVVQLLALAVGPPEPGRRVATCSRCCCKRTGYFDQTEVDNGAVGDADVSCAWKPYRWRSAMAFCVLGTYEALRLPDHSTISAPAS